jgi:hypothetical protein
MLKKIFTKLDSDCSGAIDMEELVKALATLDPGTTANEMHNTMREIDTDGDGKITFSELKTWWKKGRQGATLFGDVILKKAENFLARMPGNLKIVEAC